MLTTAPTRRADQLRDHAEDLVLSADGTKADDFDHLDADQALEWHRAWTPPERVSKACADAHYFLGDALDHAEHADLERLKVLALRTLGAFTLDDAVELRDVLRRILIDYALGEMRLELQPYIDDERARRAPALKMDREMRRIA